MKKILFGLLGLLWAIPSWANCNLFNGYNSAAVTLDETNNVLSNKVRDTRTNFQLQVQMQKTDNSYFIPINQADIATGKQTFTFNVPEDIKYFAIKHNGVTQDIKITPDTLLPSAGTYTLSFDVLSNDPTIVGGLQLQNIKLERGSTATLYTPYDANCVERCANLYNYSYRNSEHYELVDGNTLRNTSTTNNTRFQLSIYDSVNREMAASNVFTTPGNYNVKFNVVRDNNAMSMYHSGSNGNLGFFTSRKINPGEYVLSFDLLSANPSVVGGLQLKNISLQPAYCSEIQVASTKYAETVFNPLNTALQSAISVVDSVVSNTISQAASIATLQSGKQTRPDETCPAGKKCLLVEGTDGKPHWYEIITSRLPDGYTELEYIESTGTQWIDTNVPVTDDISWEGRLLSKNDTNKATSIFGYRWTETPTATGNMRFVFLYPNGAFAVRFGVNASQSNLVMSGSEVITLKYENDKFYANGNLFFTETDKNHDGEAQSGYLFNANALYNVDIIPSKMKLYYFKMWDNGTLVRDFVPAKNSSGIIGMYDLVSGEFFTNQGTGTFIGGQPVFN